MIHKAQVTCIYFDKKNITNNLYNDFANYLKEEEILLILLIRSKCNTILNKVPRKLLISLLTNYL